MNIIYKLYKSLLEEGFDRIQIKEGWPCLPPEKNTNLSFLRTNLNIGDEESGVIKISREGTSIIIKKRSHRTSWRKARALKTLADGGLFKVMEGILKIKFVDRRIRSIENEGCPVHILQEEEINKIKDAVDKFTSEIKNHSPKGEIDFITVSRGFVTVDLYCQYQIPVRKVMETIRIYDCRKLE